MLTVGIYVAATISGAAGPWMTPKLGLKKLSAYGYSMSFIRLMAVGVVERINWLMPIP